MADSDTIDARFKRTYTLTVPVLDLLGDAPSPGQTVVATVRLVRVDGAENAPLFGPGGLLTEPEQTIEIRPEAVQSGSDLHPASVTFDIIPNGYWFVPTIYMLTVGGRSYTFTMPAADTGIVALIDAETGTSPEGGGGGTPGVTVRGLPSVVSVSDMSALVSAQELGGTPIFALIGADFGDYEVGDLWTYTGSTDGWVLLVRTHTPTARIRGQLRAWFQPPGAAAALPENVAMADITDNRPGLALSHDGSDTAQTLHVTYPVALDADYDAILIDGAPFTTLFARDNATVMANAAAQRVQSLAGVDLTGGVGPLYVELVLRTTP